VLAGSHLPIRLAFATGECIGLAIGLPMANGECKEEKKKVL
jgi:hypothetical protein